MEGRAIIPRRISKEEELHRAGIDLSQSRPEPRQLSHEEKIEKHLATIAGAAKFFVALTLIALISTVVLFLIWLVSGYGSAVN